MTQFQFVLLAYLFLQSAPGCREPSIQQLVHDAPVVAVAEIEQLEQPLGFWSGTFLVVQRVHYRVKTVLKGEIKQDQVTVGYYVVANSSTADTEQAQLSPKIFVKGKAVILFLTSDPEHGYLAMPEDEKRKPYQHYLALDSKCGLISPNENTLREIKQYTSKTAH